MGVGCQSGSDRLYALWSVTLSQFDDDDATTLATLATTLDARRAKGQYIYSTQKDSHQYHRLKPVHGQRPSWHGQRPTEKSLPRGAL